MRTSPLFASLLSCLIALSAKADDSQPTIARIRGRTVTVKVPAGFDSVSLQKIRSISRSKGAAERVWATVDTQFPSAQEATLTFRLTKLASKRNLRVIGSRSQPLPASFLGGLSSFGADPLTLQQTSTPAVNRVSDGAVTLAGGSSVANLSTTGVSGGTAPATVVESDIWKIDGDRLYFFNQLRGLQVIDISTPDDPALLGTLRMPASGEDLYLLDQNHVALLKRSNNWWGGIILNGGIVRSEPVALNIASGSTISVANARLAPQTTLLPTSDATRENELVIADVSGGAPVQVASVPFTGSLRESRLVGHVLYVAAGASRQTTAGYEYGTTVTAFDLADPANPLQRDSVFVPGWASMVTATSDYFIVTTGWPNQLQLVDISAGDGTLKLSGSLAPEGYVADKFKISVENGVLTVLSQVWLPWTWDATAGVWSGGGASTVLQTFSLADASAPAALGRLEIAKGESLRATRFDSGRVYVVTFEQVDPLHIVDLSDPANPVVSGSVEAPGFSTYIEPLGDRLVTIGLVNWRPAVSLFDVSNPAAPTLLQQLELGGKSDGWSSSEAVWNEKAFKVIADQNLILLPISGVDLAGTDQWGGEWFSRVQLVDLKHDSLAARGVVDASFSPRRADVVKANRIAAISPSKLVVVNAGNRDEPKVTAEIELAWSVDRVIRIGDYLVQLGGSADWVGKPTPTLSVSPAAQPDQTLASVDLDPLDLVGSTVHDGTLYLAQRAWPRWWVSDAAENKPQLLVTAYDVSALPKLKKLSQASGPAPVNAWGQLTPLWPSPGVLVWAADGQYLSWEAPQPRVPDVTVDPVVTGEVTGSLNVDLGTLNRPLTRSTRSIALPNFFCWWGTYSKQFISFNVTAPEKIAYSSTVELKPTKYSMLSAPSAQAGLVFTSEQKTWDENADAGTGEAGKHFLRVIDYTEPAAPFIREERVNIPGRLASVAREGKLLYTVGPDIDTTTGAAKDGAALHASSFDGTAAHLIATEPLPSVWSPVAFSGQTVVSLDPQSAQIWQPDAPGTVHIMMYPYWGGTYVDNPIKSTLHLSQLTDAGSFTELSSLEVGHDYSLHLYGDLAVTQPDYRSVRLIDLSNTLAPAELGTFSLPGGSWPNLDGSDGALGVGFWIPTGAYGVETIGLGK